MPYKNRPWIVVFARKSYQYHEVRPDSEGLRKWRFFCDALVVLLCAGTVVAASPVSARTPKPHGRMELMTPDELEKVLAEAPIAFVPVGTFEHHGWHLPVCFDGIKAHALCERVAERTGGTVLPAFFYGTGGGHFGYKWTLMLPEAQIVPLIEATLDHLARQGFKVVVLLTGHYPQEQVNMVHRLAREAQGRHPKVRFIGLTEPEVTTPNRATAYGGDHAAKYETSIALALNPAWVQLNRLTPDRAPEQVTLPDTPRKDASTHDPTHPLYAIHGQDPRERASKELGEKLVNEIVARLADIVIEALGQADERLRPVAWTEAELRHPPLSDSMSLDEIERALAAHPPAWDQIEARAAIAVSLDRQVAVQVRDGMTDADRAPLRPLLEFYRRRVDAGLDALEQARVTNGVRVFKFYSSSLVLQSAEGTVAVDFCQGPINNGGEPEARDVRRTGFFWTPRQRDRLARLVEVSLITHRHHDHADYSLANRLVAQRKTVIGPAQLKALWKDLAANITVPAYGTAQRFGPVEIFTMLGSQYSRNAPSGTGTERVGVPANDPAVDSESGVYLLRLGGLTFLQGAENHVPAGEWLLQAIGRGFAPDVLLSAGQFQGQRSVDAVLRTRPEIFRIPVHEYELMHEGGGNRTAPWFRDGGRRLIEQRRSLPLFWGEHILLTRAMLGDDTALTGKR